MRKAAWLVVWLAGCGGGDDGGGATPSDGGVVTLDAQVDMALPGCAPDGYQRGACCEHPSGSEGVCTDQGCTAAGGAAEFDLLCLALCDEQCTLGDGQVGPCCLLDGGGTGICAAGACEGPDGPQANPTCEAIAALPDGVGCGRRITGVLLDGACTRDSECDLDLECVDDGLFPERYCAPSCAAAEATCPDFFACVEGACVRSGRLGQGCQESRQCQSQLCIMVEGGVQYCSQPCSEDVPCPEPFACDAANMLCLMGM